MSEARSYSRPVRRNEANWSVIIAFCLLLIIVMIGVTGYILIEGMNFTQAVYMTIITVATVGFKEVDPLSELGMWFTSFLIVISFGIFVHAVTSLAKCFEGKLIEELWAHNKTGANIIGFRRPDRSYIINPGSTVKLSCEDQLFVLGTVDQINHMKKLLSTEL